MIINNVHHIGGFKYACLKELDGMCDLYTIIPPVDTWAKFKELKEEDLRLSYDYERKAYHNSIVNKMKSLDHLIWKE